MTPLFAGQIGHLLAPSAINTHLRPFGAFFVSLLDFHCSAIGWLNVLIHCGFC